MSAAPEKAARDNYYFRPLNNNGVVGCHHRQGTQKMSIAASFEKDECCVPCPPATRETHQCSKGHIATPVWPKSEIPLARYISAIAAMLCHGRWTQQAIGRSTFLSGNYIFGCSANCALNKSRKGTGVKTAQPLLNNLHSPLGNLRLATSALIVPRIRTNRRTQHCTRLNGMGRWRTNRRVNCHTSYRWTHINGPSQGCRRECKISRGTPHTC